MVPESPDAPSSVNGTSAAAETSRQAGLIVNLRLRVIVRLDGAKSAVAAGIVPLTTMSRGTARGVLALVVASAVGAALLAPLASADELTDQRNAVASKIEQTRKDLNESTKELSAAVVAVQQAESSLAIAQAQLAQTRVELAAATKADIAMAAKLKQAQLDLEKAKAAVVAGQKALDAERLMAGNMVRDQYQQQTNLLPIAMLVDGNNTADLQTRLQWSTTMFDTQTAQISLLTVLQAKLTAEQARQAELEKQIAADRITAAENLTTKKTLETQATQQETAVAGLLAQSSAAKAAAAGEVDSDKQRYADLNAERAAVEKRIADRIAKAKAEAARKAAAERVAAAAAKKAAAEARQAAAEAQARQEASDRAERARQKARSSSSASKATSRSSAPRAAAPKVSAPQVLAPKKSTPKRTNSGASSSSSNSSSSSSNSSGSSSNAGHGFSYPVSAPITSPYGMRFHPVLHVWKLHDGTDFGAGCGTAIRAPYAGTVSEKYYNAGYGNRLLLDHGTVDGRYVTTAFNHAIRYTVGVGQRVNKGDVIGYVGTTGYSTGCHLHLMVYLDGSMVNPMTWF